LLLFDCFVLCLSLVPLSDEPAGPAYLSAVRPRRLSLTTAQSSHTLSSSSSRCRSHFQSSP
jgi:hypothetical protein